MVEVFGGLTDETGPSLPFLKRPTDAPTLDAGGPNPAEFLRLFLSDNVRWVAGACAPVLTEQWQSAGCGTGNPLVGLETLYDGGALVDDRS